MIPPTRALTLAEWRAWNQTARRNYTDPPIANDPVRRQHDAANSALHTTEPERTIDPRLPRTGDYTPSGYRRKAGRGASVAVYRSVTSETTNGDSSPENRLERHREASEGTSVPRKRRRGGP